MIINPKVPTNNMSVTIKNHVKRENLLLNYFRFYKDMFFDFVEPDFGHAIGLSLRRTLVRFVILFSYFCSPLFNIFKIYLYESF